MNWNLTLSIPFRKNIERSVTVLQNSHPTLWFPRHVAGGDAGSEVEKEDAFPVDDGGGKLNGAVEADVVLF